MVTMILFQQAPLTRQHPVGILWPTDRSTTSITDNIAVKTPLLSVETSSDVQVNADVIPHLDTFNTASSSQSSGKSDSEGNTCSHLCVANSTETESYTALLESILRSDTLCFYYTGLPTVEILKYLFKWIDPTAKTQTYGMVVEKHIPGRKGGRKRNRHFEEYILCLLKIRQGYGS